MSKLTELSIEEIQKSFKEKDFSSKELTLEYLKNIKEKDDTIGAFLTITEDKAIELAEQVDKKIANGEKISPIAGVPCAIKDNMCTNGVKTTCASKMLEDFVPCYDATVIENLKKNDFVMLGKLNMDEFAMGSSNENSYFKKVRNPVNIDCVPGGSSGGSAAAVKACEAVYTLGSDTGGSIRQPASFCGVVGMKPTYGTVSRYGLVAFASSLDQIGPITKSVKDNAIVLNAIASSDGRDATCIQGDREDFTADIGKDVKGMKIALPTDFFAEGISQDVKDAVLNAAKTYEKMGAEIVEVKLPNLKHALSAYYVISSAEAS
ncbi:MAG: amidase family protein, partial [Clostridia bacterium]